MPAGRPPRNPVLKQAEGAYRKDPQRVPKHFIETEEGWPEATEIILLDELATRIWDYVCTTLFEIGLLNRTDSTLIEAFVLNYREFLILTADVRKNGYVDFDKKRPQVDILHKTSDRHIKLMNELGLTPTARLRLAGPSNSVPSSDVQDVLKRLGCPG